MTVPSPGQDTGLAIEPKQPEKSLGELFADLANELGALVRNELELAKTETRQEMRKAGQAGASFAAVAVAVLLVLTFLSSALAWLLDRWINRALAFLIVAILWGAVAALTINIARNRIRDIEPMPQTMETLKEDVEWAKQQRS